MSNAPRVLGRFGRECTGRDGDCSRAEGGRHVPASGRIANDTARYSDGLCRTMTRGMMDEMQAPSIWRPGEVVPRAVTDEDGADARTPASCNGKSRDDISGQLLRDDLGRQARSKELRYVCDKGVRVKRTK